MIPVEYDEGQQLIKNYECDCGGTLVLAWAGAQGIEGYVVKCAKDDDHTAIRKIRSITQAYRQGVGVPVHIEDRIERRMLPTGADIDQQLNLLAIRYPSADLDRPSAALFLMDCFRLGLDPLLGEAVPVAFHNKKLNKKVVTPIISEDGYLSMACRACPDRWAGPPSVEPVTDPALKKEICDDEEAWVWRATGRTKDMEPGQVSTTYGWYKRSERAKADDRVPAKGLPGNQARVRAIKRWIRENFPEARARMKELTAEWMAQAEGVKEAQAIIEVEYTVFAAELPAGDGHEEPEPPASPAEAPAASALTPGMARGNTQASTTTGRRRPRAATPPESEAQAKSDAVQLATPQMKARLLEIAQEFSLAQTMQQLVQLVKNRGIEFDKMTVAEATAMANAWKKPGGPREKDSQSGQMPGL